MRCCILVALLCTIMSRGKELPLNVVAILLKLFKGGFHWFKEEQTTTTSSHQNLGYMQWSFFGKRVFFYYSL